MSQGDVLPGADDPRTRHRAYEALVGRIRDLIHRTVPPGVTVAVVSKGDPDLVALNGRQGWHFPQDDGGGYAGYHPRDSAAAIEGLEALRARGAEFLVLPATSRWWLDHYVDLAAYLQRSCETLVDQPDAGIVYRLARTPMPAPTPKVPPGSPGYDLTHHRSALLMQQIGDLVHHLLPAGQPVAVVDRPNAVPVQLDGRPTMHLHVAEDAGAPHPSAVGALPVARLETLLETLRHQGAAYLLVTQRAFDWWRSDEVLRPHVEQRYDCVTNQAHVCLIYDLIAGEETVGP